MQTRDPFSIAISIHALRMERDVLFAASRFLWTHFNPRAPHGARQYRAVVTLGYLDISIHALRMERDLLRH